MRRREFLATSCVAGLASLGGISQAASSSSAQRRDYFELRRYHIETEAAKEMFERFMAEAAIPALNRIDVKPVGVFYALEDLSPIYVLLRHRTLQSFATATQKLLTDEEFLRKGKAFLDAPATAPAYKRMESALMVAFSAIPQLETPITKPGRIFQLRIYESPSIKTGQKKIEMFSTAELEIFRKTGLHPVFFGETLSGAGMPNLTYMLVFNDMQEQQQNWRRFGGDPDWKKLRAIPEYADKRILCNITNIFLKPADCSQI